MVEESEIYQDSIQMLKFITFVIILYTTKI